MFDKYHYQWIYNDFSTQVKIFKAQKKAFDFMSQLANDVDKAVKSINDIDTSQGQWERLDMMNLEVYYYKIANGIGEQWLEVK